MANIPDVLARESYEQLQIDTKTPSGIKRVIEIATGDEELAEQVRINLVQLSKLQAASAQGM